MWTADDSDFKDGGRLRSEATAGRDGVRGRSISQPGSGCSFALPPLLPGPGQPTRRRPVPPKALAGRVGGTCESIIIINCSLRKHQTRGGGLPACPAVWTFCIGQPEGLPEGSRRSPRVRGERRPPGNSAGEVPHPGRGARPIDVKQRMPSQSLPPGFLASPNPISPAPPNTSTQPRPEAHNALPSSPPRFSGKRPILPRFS